MPNATTAIMPIRPAGSASTVELVFLGGFLSGVLYAARFPDDSRYMCQTVQPAGRVRLDAVGLLPEDAAELFAVLDRINARRQEPT